MVLQPVISPFASSESLANGHLYSFLSCVDRCRSRPPWPFHLHSGHHFVRSFCGLPDSFLESEPLEAGAGADAAPSVEMGSVAAGKSPGTSLPCRFPFSDGACSGGVSLPFPDILLRGQSVE